MSDTLTLQQLLILGFFTLFFFLGLWMAIDSINDSGFRENNPHGWAAAVAGWFTLTVIFAVTNLSILF